jgi:hypothetical protein
VERPARPQHDGERLAARVEKMLAAGRITADEAERVRAAPNTGDLDAVVDEIRRRHAAEWAAAAVANGRITDEEASEILAALERGDDVQSIRRLRNRGGHT